MTIQDVRLRMVIQDTIGDALRASCVLALQYVSGAWIDPAGGHELTNINGAGVTGSYLGNLVTLNGDISKQFLTTPADMSDLSPGNHDFTLVSFVRLNTLPPIVGDLYYSWLLAIKDNANGDDEYMLGVSQVTLPSGIGGFRFLINANNTIPSVYTGENPVANTNYVVIAWYDSAAQSINLQINNETVFSQTIPSPMSVISAPTMLDIGFDSGGGTWPTTDGNLFMDGQTRLYVFSRLLTSLEKSYLQSMGLYP